MSLHERKRMHASWIYIYTLWLMKNKNAKTFLEKIYNFIDIIQEKTLFPG